MFILNLQRSCKISLHPLLLFNILRVRELNKSVLGRIQEDKAEDEGITN